MGQHFFGIDLAATAAAEGDNFADVTLTVVSYGARATAFGPRAPTETAHACKGFVGNYTDRQRENSLIEKGDRRVVILAETLPAGVKPEPEDLVTIATVAYRIKEVTTGAATATWVCQSTEA